MSASNGLGLLSLVIFTLGLDCLKMENTTQKLKNPLLTLGGISLELWPVPSVWAAHIIIQEFWAENTPQIVLGWEMGCTVQWLVWWIFYNSRGISTLLHNLLIIITDAVCNGRYARHPSISGNWKWKTFKRVDIRFSDFLLLHYHEKGLLNRQVTVYKIVSY